MNLNWSDPYGVTTTDRNEEIKVFIPEGFSFCDERDKELQKYLPCIAVVTQIVGDALYHYDLITKDGVIKTCGYAHALPIYLLKTIFEDGTIQTQ